MSLVEEALGGSSVFKDESKLSLEYIPSFLPGRKNELLTLTQLFRSLIDRPGEVSQKVLIKGKVGTGKTVLARRFCQDFEEAARVRDINIHCVHVNCRIDGSFFNILKNIIRDKFQQTFPERGFSSEEALQILMSLLDEEDAHLVLILDELEALIEREGSTPLYSLSRIQESRPSNSPQRLSLICVFRIPQCEDTLRSLDTSTRGTLGHRIIDLDEYGSRELLEILDHRVKESFKENAILDEAVNLISDIASQPNSGSARAAVELTYLSGKCADNMGVPMVLPMHVRMVQPHLSLAVKIEDLETLRKHERLLLLAIARSLACRPEEAYVGMGETEKMYSVICEEFGKEPRRHTQVWKYVQALSSIGLITTKISGSGIQGKTTLIGLPLPARDLERELSNILKGVS